MQKSSGDFRNSDFCTYYQMPLKKKFQWKVGFVKALRLITRAYSAEKLTKLHNIWTIT